LKDFFADSETAFIVRLAWSRRKYYPVGVNLSRLLECYFVVSTNQTFGTEFPDALSEVVYETVVIVDN